MINAPACPARRVLVIHNPTAGWRRRRRFERILAALIGEGLDIRVRRTTKRGDAEAFAAEATAAEFDVVAIAGGDGTINEAVNGLTDPNLALAVIPLGTANVLAHEIGLGGAPADIARTIAIGEPRAISVGVVNGRKFVMMAGVGFDAFVIASIRPRLKRVFGKTAYVLTTLWALFRFKFPRYQVTVDGKTFDVASAVIANGHYYGGTFVCAPEARLWDPTLHVCLFLGGGAWRTLQYAAALTFGRLDRLSDVVVVPANAIEVEPVDHGPVQGDGDVLAHLPARISLLPAALRILVPA